MENKRKDEELIKVASQARQNAYAPYSGFKVGAALLTRDGHIFSGVNVENASYPLAVCAERAALIKAISEGYRDFEKLVIVTDTEKPCPPCGACRQTLFEFNSELCILMVPLKGDQEEKKLKELLPEAFDLKELKGGA